MVERLEPQLRTGSGARNRRVSSPRRAGLRDWGWRLASLTLLASLVLTVVLLRGQLFERVEVVEEREVSAEARSQPYLALGELLRRKGLPTDFAPGTRDLPPADHVLWWLTEPRSRPAERLLGWAEAGGHLIVGAEQAPDELLEAVQIGVFYPPEADADDHLSMPEYQSDRPAWPKLYATEGSDVENLIGEGATDAAWNLTVTYGSGLVTVVNDLAFLTNRQLATKDHALLAWQLTLADEGRTGARIVSRDPPPSIWAAIGARSRPAALSLAVLALAALWAFARRMGPIAPSPSRDRRHLAEHVRATGQFLWHVGCEDALLAAQRAALADDLRRRGAGNLDRGQKLVDAAAALAERRQLDAGAVSWALKLREMPDRDRFVQVVRLLETLRRGDRGASRPAKKIPNRLDDETRNERSSRR